MFRVCAHCHLSSIFFSLDDALFILHAMWSMWSSNLCVLFMQVKKNTTATNQLEMCCSESKWKNIRHFSQLKCITLIMYFSVSYRKWNSAIQNGYHFHYLKFKKKNHFALPCPPFQLPTHIIADASTEFI